MVKYIDEISKETSVKHIGIIERSTSLEAGVADMTLEPVFSVFDIGTIIPPIPLDNSTVAIMAGFNFELLKDAGLPSHYLGMVAEDGSLTTAQNLIRLRTPSSTMRVNFVNRVLPKFVEGEGWDYSMFANPENNNYMHPIEFISRVELPPEASIWKPFNKGEVTIEQLREQYGLPVDFQPGDTLPEALLTYSTKYEPADRNIFAAEVQTLMGVTDERFARINVNTRKASDLMTSYANSRGFKRLDGKVEYATLVINGEQVDVFADAVCTWHEDRLLWNGLGVSKQRIRNKAKKVNPKWYAEIERAKIQALEKGVEDFRTLMNPNIQYTSPAPEFFVAYNNLMRSATNQWIGQPLYQSSNKKDSLPDALDRAAEEFKKVA